MAPTKRIIGYAKALELEGFIPEIVIYTRTEVYGKKPKNTDGYGIYEGISFRYVKGTPLREKNVLSRVLNDFLDFIRLKSYLKKNLKPGDIALLYGQDLSSRALIKIAHQKGARFIQELCELPFGTDIESSRTKKQRRLFEKKILPYVDGIISISDALAKYAKKFCKAECKITKIPILVDFKKYELEDRRNSSDIPFIFHSGTLFEQKDGFLSMLEAFGRMQSICSLKTLFISTGNPEGSRHEKEIANIIDRYSLHDKVVFTGFLEETELREYLSKASFVVINKLPTQQNEYCFSTKLGEYMAASKAILITNVGEAMNWLRHKHDAYIIPSGSIDELATSMKFLFENPDLCAELGENAHQTVNLFSIKSNSLKLKEAVS